MANKERGVLDKFSSLDTFVFLHMIVSMASLALSAAAAVET